MKCKVKKIISLVCVVLSVLLLGLFGYSFATFLISTAEEALSFAEAAKNFLLFLASAVTTFGTLCMGAAFAFVSAFLGEGKLRKAARGLLVFQLVLLFFFLVVLVSMNIILPEGTV